MGVERVLDRGVAGLGPGQALERIRVVVQADTSASVLELATAEYARGRCPDRTVPFDPLRAQVGAERNQLGEVADRLHAADLFDPHEAVRVQVVAEQERRVRILGREQAGLSVVQKVALVDRLDSEGVPVLAEPREDRVALLCFARAQRGRPELALTPGVRGDRLP